LLLYIPIECFTLFYFPFAIPGFLVVCSVAGRNQLKQSLERCNEFPLSLQGIMKFNQPARFLPASLPVPLVHFIACVALPGPGHQVIPAFHSIFYMLDMFNEFVAKLEGRLFPCVSFPNSTCVRFALTGST
jgi:hypothetical protein